MPNTLLTDDQVWDAVQRNFPMLYALLEEESEELGDAILLEMREALVAGRIR